MIWPVSQDKGGHTHPMDGGMVTVAGWQSGPVAADFVKGIDAGPGPVFGPGPDARHDEMATAVPPAHYVSVPARWLAPVRTGWATTKGSWALIGGDRKCNCP